MASCGQLRGARRTRSLGKWQIDEKLRRQTGEKPGQEPRSATCRVTRKMRTCTWSRFSS